MVSVPDWSEGDTFTDKEGRRFRIVSIDPARVLDAISRDVDGRTGLECWFPRGWSIEWSRRRIVLSGASGYCGLGWSSFVVAVAWVTLEQPHVFAFADRLQRARSA